MEVPPTHKFPVRATVKKSTELRSDTTWLLDPFIILITKIPGYSVNVRYLDGRALPPP